MNQALAETGTPVEPIKLKIVGMDCGSCAMTIESSMRQLTGVEDASVSFTTETMEVTGNVAVADIETRLKELGYRIANENDAAQAAAGPEHRGLRGFLAFLWEQPPLRRAVMVTVAVFAGIVIIPTAGIGPLAGIPALTILFGSGVIVAGAPVFIKGMRALIFARRITIDLLMAVACIGALGIGATGEAVTVILLFMLGEALEAYSAERARDSLRSLMALQPQEATVLESHDSPHADDDDTHEHGAACSGHDHDHDEHSHDDHKHATETHAHADAHADHGHDHDDAHAHASAALKKLQVTEQHGQHMMSITTMVTRMIRANRP